MIYDTSKPYDREQAITRFKYLLKHNKVVIIKEQRRKRTLKQNAFIHVLIDIFAIETGLTRAEAKIYIKRRLGYVYMKDGYEYYKSTKDFSVEEASLFIDKLMYMSSQEGIFLPSSEQYLEEEARFTRERINAEKYL